MTQHFKHFSLSACALAASLLLSACGGGESTDTVAPTVAITDNVAGATAAGAVTFTFTFSEDVGSSFVAEDITVTGGTAGALTKVDALHYTLVVTPAAGATGTINVAVAALRFTDLALNGNTAAASAQQAYDTMAPATDPTTAAATPTALAADVLSIYSDAYTPVAGVNLRPDWGQSTQVSEVTIAGNKTQLYTAFNYEGITFTPIDVSAMTKLHVDVWTPDLTALDVYVLAGGAEQFVKLTPTLAGWNSFDISLSDYTTLNKAAVKELKLVSTGGSKVYLDNIYFWKPAAAGGGGVCAAPNCVDFSGTGIGFGVFENNGGTAAIGNDPTSASNKVVAFVKKPADGDYFGTTITGLGVSPVLTADQKTITMRVYSPKVGTNFLLKLEGGTGGPATTERDLATTKANEWETLSFVMPDAGTFSTIVVFPHGRSKVTADTAIYIDDLTFPATVTAGGGGGGGGGSNTFTGGIFSSDYSGNLGANTAKSDKGGTVGFFVDPRLFAVKIFEDGSVCGSACNPGGVYNFYYGIGRPATPTYTDAYFGGFVNAPGNTTADASAYAKVKLKFWGDAESWEKLNFTAQVDVVLQGPVNAACINPSGRPEITRAVTAQKIGAGSDYVIPKTDFVLTANCGGAYTVNSVWSAIGAVVVRLTGSGNLNYVNLTPSNPPSYPTFLNIGPIAFIN
jgi:hypothetical protein